MTACLHDRRRRWCSSSAGSRAPDRRATCARADTGLFSRGQRLSSQHCRSPFPVADTRASALLVGSPAPNDALPWTQATASLRTPHAPGTGPLETVAAPTNGTQPFTWRVLVFRTRFSDGRTAWSCHPWHKRYKHHSSHRKRSISSKQRVGRIDMFRWRCTKKKTTLRVRLEPNHVRHFCPFCLPESVPWHFLCRLEHFSHSAFDTATPRVATCRSSQGSNFFA